jgi:hypothetical protein
MGTAVLVFSFLLAVSTACAQTLTGTVAGRVTDEQGAILPGATVTLLGLTGARTEMADSKGTYRFPALAPGTYTVRAELQGFRPKQQGGVVIDAGGTVDVSLTLALGGLSEMVEVVGNRPLLDAVSTATDTKLSQDLLFNMPLSHANASWDLLQYTPGVVAGSAFGASDGSGNALLLDGVDTRDPSAGTAWLTYDYNLIEEIQVAGLGQQAEYGGFTGVVVNTVTKSGGNRLSFLGDVRYTNHSSWLFAGNADPALVAQNPNLGVPARILRLNDYTAQLGGPLKHDKVFYFASIQRYEDRTKQTGPIVSSVSPRFNIKLSLQPTARDSLTMSFQYDQLNVTGRIGLIPGWAIVSQDQTESLDSPEELWNLQYRRIFSSSTFLEAKYTGYTSYADKTPVSRQEAHYDGQTNAWWGGAGYGFKADRSRHQVNISLSKYSQLAGTHTFKFGMEIERSGARDQLQFSGAGVLFYDLGGPYIAYGYSYDLQSRNKRESYYAQDQWTIGRRLTANLGVRVDHIRGEAAVTGQELWNTLSVGPRLGVSWDATGRGRSVARASYGRLYESAMAAMWNRAMPGMSDTVYYLVGPNWSTLTEYARNPAALMYSVDTANTRQPRVDEITVSWEQALGSSVRLTATGIWRDWHSFVNEVLEGGQWTSANYSLPVWTGPEANPIAGTTTVPTYQWANPTETPQFLIRNTDAVQYTIDGRTVTAAGTRTYRGLMLVLDRPLRNRWQARISWVLSKTQGSVVNDAIAGIVSTQFDTPNQVLTNADGPTPYDRRHQFQVFAGWQIPKVEVALNAYWFWQSAAPYSVYASVPASQTRWTRAMSINVVPTDAFLGQSVSNTAVRVEKVLRFGVHRFGFYADIQNVFNLGSVTSQNGLYPNRTLTDSQGNDFKVWLGGPLAQVAGRQTTLGVRWTF